MLVAGAELAQHREQGVADQRESISSTSSTSGVGFAKHHSISKSFSAASGPDCCNMSSQTRRGKSSPRSRALDARLLRMERIPRAVCPSRATWAGSTFTFTQRKPAHFTAVQEIAQGDERGGLAGLARRVQDEVAFRLNQVQEFVDVHAGPAAAPSQGAGGVRPGGLRVHRHRQREEGAEAGAEPHRLNRNPRLTLQPPPT